MNISQYYDDRDFVSNSMINMLLESEEKFELFMSGQDVNETTSAMMMGTVFHHRILNEMSGGVLNLVEDEGINVVDDFGDLRTKAGKAAKLEAFKAFPDGNFLQKSEYAKALMFANNVLKDPFTSRYFDEISQGAVLSVEEAITNVIYLEDGTGAVHRIPIKGKLDIVYRYEDTGLVKKVVDLKTTREVSSFKSSVYKYGYNRQCVQYAQLTDTDLEDGVMDFFAYGKEDGLCRVFETSRRGFIEASTASWLYGMGKFIKWKEGDYSLKIDQL